METKELYHMSYEMRMDAVRMVYHAKTGHIAPCLSAAEIISTLYFDTLNVNPTHPRWEDRDRFILSKGHACPIYYSALAHKGFFPTNDLMLYRGLNTKLQGHPDMRKCPGVDMTTGSLGNGLSAAVGMALIGKKDHKNHWVFSLTGDGEMQEGIIWESIMCAGNAGLDNLIIFVDCNGLQSGGSVTNIQSLGDLSAKFESFDWTTQTIDGHNIDAIKTAIRAAKEKNGKPAAILAQTTKGKGVSFMENQYLWHMKAPNDEQYVIAMDELQKEAEKYA